jgi:hypothetical protein
VYETSPLCECAGGVYEVCVVAEKVSQTGRRHPPSAAKSFERKPFLSSHLHCITRVAYRALFLTMPGNDAVVRTWDAWTTTRLADLTQSRLLRSLRPVHPFDATTTTQIDDSQYSRPRNQSEGDEGGNLSSPSPSYPPTSSSSSSSSSAATSASSPMTVRVAPETMRAWLSGEHDLGDSAAAKTNSDSYVPCTLRLFSSNDYLGMSSHPDVRAAAAGAALRWGSGPRSSALVCGYTHDHRVLESGIASLKETAECLLFPTGYAANVGTIPALADGPDCHVFSDALNHASIIDGCRLAARRGARVSTYRHCDVAHLEELIEASPAPRKMVITDSLFSMDGDFAPLAELAAGFGTFHAILQSTYQLKTAREWNQYDM